MEKNKGATLQQIAENALADSVVRLELWQPASYSDYVVSFNVENPTKYQQKETVEDLLHKITEEHLSYASGFFVDKHIIATNFHVAQGKASLIAELVNKQEKCQIEAVAAFDVEKDLILLKVAGEGVPLKLGDSEAIKNEDVICAVGYPNGVAEITHGVIDGVRESDQRIRMRIETTDGSSGCPIFNRHGETIGVDASGDEVYSYAVPSNTLTELIDNAGESITLKDWQKSPCIRTFTETKAGNKLLKEGDYKKAIAHYDTAIELNPEMIKAYKGRSDAKMELGLMAEGISDQLTVYRLKSVPFSFTNLKEYLSWKWVTILLIGLSLSIKLLKTILGERNWLVGGGNSKIREAKSEANQGNNTKAQRLYQEAINLFTDAINLAPKVAITYKNRGWTKYLMGQLKTEQGNTTKAEKLYQETVDDVNLALRLKPKLARIQAACHHTRGAAKAALDDHDGAIEDFNESIRLRPKKALYYHDRGLSKQALGQHEAAETDFVKAKELAPD